MRLSIDARLDYMLSAPADLLIALEVAQTAEQQLVTDKLLVTGVGSLRPIDAQDGLGRRTWARGTDRVTAHYRAIVDVDRAAPNLPELVADDLLGLPTLVVPYLFPSRYCESDRFEQTVTRDFADKTGGAKIQEIVDWIRGHLDYGFGASDARTTAVDTYVARRGVCRDFAHLLIAMARASGIPARMVAAYAWRLDAPDFHAVVEVWLSGCWHLVDPTGLAPIEGIVQIGVGRDATDVSFLTIFGRADLIGQQVSVEQIDG